MRSGVRISLMSNAAKLKKRAAELEQKKQFDKALAVYVQVLEESAAAEEEADVALYNRVGDLMFRLGNVAEALSYYEKAVDLYAERGFLNNAIALCNKILRQSPGRTSVYYKLGRISATKGFKSDAKKNYLEYADRMRAAAKPDEAFRALKEFADLCPDQDDIRLMLAELLSKENRKDEAIEQLHALYEKLDSEGRSTEARATIERMQALDPGASPSSSGSRPAIAAGDLVFLDLSYDEPSSSRTPTPAQIAPPQGLEQTPQAEDLGEIEVPSTPMGFAPTADETTLDITPPSIALEGFEAGALEVTDIEVGVAIPGDFSIEPIAIDDLPGESSAVGEDLPLLETPDLPMLSGIDLPEEPTPEEPELRLEAVEITDESFAGSLLGDPADAGSLVDFDAPTEFTDLSEYNPLDDPDLVADPPAAEPIFAESLEEIDLGSDIDAGAPIVRLEESEREILATNEELEVLAERSAEPIASDTDDVDFDALIAAELREEPAPEIQTFDDQPYSVSDPGLVALEDTFLEGEGVAAAIRFTPPMSEVVTPTEADLLRDELELEPTNWALRRRYGEALLDRGDRHQGLAEIEGAMYGLERDGDLDGAFELADELVRLSPEATTHHQKRVEYAVRVNDRARLIDSYIELADALFRSGETEKSRAVFQRVAALAPDNPRAQSALTLYVPEPSIESTPPVAPAAIPARHRPTPARTPTPLASPAIAPPRPAAAVPGSDDDFVDLGDWLRTQEGPKSTRMTTQAPVPTGDEDLDFAEMLRRFKRGVEENVDEEDSDSHYDLGVAYKEMGLLDEAIAEFQKALRGTAQRARTFEALGECFLSKGQHKVAATVLTQALAASPADDHQLVGVLYLLAFACESMQKWGDALGYYQRVFAVDIQFKDVTDRLSAMERLTQ
jgi:tetratricopeptide (TPR) repeat protein